MIDGRRQSAPAPPPGTTSGEREREEQHAVTSPGQTPRARESWLHPGAKLVVLGVPADAVTVAGLFLAACTAVLIGRGYLYIGVALITVGGLMDFLDGAVAKAAGTASARGAFFDSVSDRIADALILGGVAWYLVDGAHPKLALLPLAILAVSMLVSYERAKAESLGFSAKGGLMERAERLILLCVGLFFHVILFPVLWLLLVLTAGTAAGRFVKVWRQASGTAEPALVVRSRAWHPAKVESRWRAWRESGRVTPRGPGRVAHGTGWSRRRSGEVTAWATRRRMVQGTRVGLGTKRAGRGEGGRTARSRALRRGLSSDR